MTLTITGKPASTKNSRVLGGGRSLMNLRAKEWLAAAKWELKQQWNKPPSEGAHHVRIVVYYANNRMLDNDNAASACLDALKGIVVKDDSPKHIPKLTIESRVSRQKRAYCEIELEAL